MGRVDRWRECGVRTKEVGYVVVDVLCVGRDRWGNLGMMVGIGVVGRFGC